MIESLCDVHFYQSVSPNHAFPGAACTIQHSRMQVFLIPLTIMKHNKAPHVAKTRRRMRKHRKHTQHIIQHTSYSTYTTPHTAQHKQHGTLSTCSTAHATQHTQHSTRSTQRSIHRTTPTAQLPTSKWTTHPQSSCKMGLGKMPLSTCVHACQLAHLHTHDSN